MPITYEQTTDKEIHDRVRRKHEAIINELKGLNFSEFYFFGETVGALGFSPLGCSGFVGMFVALFNEVSKIKRNLGITLFNVVMSSNEYGTYAAPFGLGVKFYTGFTDGTCVITANFKTPAFQDEQEKLYKFAVAQSATAVWSIHKEWVDKLCSEGRTKNEPLSFAGYLQLVQREDEYMLKLKDSGKLVM